jgi:hypothetical protein
MMVYKPACSGLPFENQVDGIKSTMNIYTPAVSEQKRSANSMVVGILFNENASTNQPAANGS